MQLDDPQFSIGQLVVLRSNPKKAGAVIEVIPGVPEYRYTLFIDGGTSKYYASQLQPQEDAAPERVLVSLSSFKARLSALLINDPSLSTLYSLHAARVNFIPYQFRPVLKFIRADRPRLLIADEVGVGKTIEAGLILRELQSRRDVNSVLILCPKPLVTERKWQTEMRRFDEQFEHLDGPALKNCLRETDLEGVWPERSAKCIVPFSLCDERVYNELSKLQPPPRFDLVIIDEAHHLRNSERWVHRVARLFCDNAEAVVFLTATPIQIRSDDLFVLLNLLRPDTILDRESFAFLSEPNAFINQAVQVARVAGDDWQVKASDALMKAASTSAGGRLLRPNPEFGSLCQSISKEHLSSEQRLRFIRDAEKLHTFSNLINRTRRRDIGNFTVRKAETVKVAFTESQQKLHDALLAAQARILAKLHDGSYIKFLMSMLRRQAASCLYGLVPFIQEILTRRMDELVFTEIDDGYEPSGNFDTATISQEIRDVVALADALDPDDPKLAALLRVVQDKQKLENNKILLFSSFRHTLSYLLRHLKAAGIRVALIQGDVPDDERRSLRNRFERPREDKEAIDVLLSSEVGCEGLDYQFCDCLINYDLPWNPMRIEQRIGRIDRYGQKSETVAIYNFVTPGTVDFEIYDRCLLRIGLFEQALGGSEEILGRITQELRSIAENLQLTDEQREAKLRQIADNDIRLIQEQTALEERQPELFGVVLPPKQVEQDVQDAASAWLTPSALQNMIQQYLIETCGGTNHIKGDSPLKTLLLSQEARQKLLADFQKLPPRTSILYRGWEKWLNGPDPRLEITFDDTCASDKREAIFITPIHPFALQAARISDGSPSIYTALRVCASDFPPGEYPFAIYQWRQRGIRDDALLQPICADQALTERFFELLQKAEPTPDDVHNSLVQAVFDALDEDHYQFWSRAKAEHLEKTAQIARFRRESLRVSHEARIEGLREQIAQADDVKIRRMRESQIGTAQADYDRHLTKINDAENRADILAEAVAFGVIIMEEAR